MRGLLRITPDRRVTVLATEADGTPIAYADDLDVARDGRIYFSDASTRFGARQGGSTYSASLLEIIEHRGNGRLLVWDPATSKATTGCAASTSPTASRWPTTRATCWCPRRARTVSCVTGSAALAAGRRSR